MSTHVLPKLPSGMSLFEARHAKRLSRSMTVRSALLFATVYLGAKLFDASQDVTQTIVVAGIGSIAFFLQRALANLYKEVHQLRALVAQTSLETPSVAPPIRHRHLFGFGILAATILMIGASLLARYYYTVSDGISQSIVVLGGVLIVIALRAAVIEFWDED